VRGTLRYNVVGWLDGWRDCVSFTFFDTQDIVKILRKVKDNFLAISRISLAPWAGTICTLLA